MQSLEIKVPDDKANLIKALLKELGIGVTDKKKQNAIPNADTIAAMKELKSGKGKRFDSVEALFNNI
ncbi:hypothetical protein [Niabella ginsengisoli]|uniref:Uncharacterized protein n=1 Tax=Niabella ginsengisoli TaxID=522298 RepID=A0ABS9SNF8_9BACT|nr:hypothetical protein [Niabella ginsengisoli]MCH5599923.1 hypothetical protein [Niabella ginsengisoli]